MEANVDPAEIRKFSDLAARWWDPKSEFRPLHEINPLRLGFIQEQCSLEGKRVLDVGCGGGILAESMALAGAQVGHVLAHGLYSPERIRPSCILFAGGHGRAHHSRADASREATDVGLSS